jgi:hypothetical protein
MRGRVIGDVGSRAARFSEQAFPQVEVNGFLGDTGLSDEFSDSHAEFHLIGSISGKVAGAVAPPSSDKSDQHSASQAAA